MSTTGVENTSTAEVENTDVEKTSTVTHLHIYSLVVNFERKFDAYTLNTLHKRS